MQFNIQTNGGEHRHQSVESEQVMTGLGIFGQFCWVHRPSRTVIARFSTWPEASREDYRDACLRAFGAIVEVL
ncbi:MAG: hypothetical protein EBY89_03865 [Actinobacteria bacterium]|nr:hypothetical protein [Actinomycetota bacterium]